MIIFLLSVFLLSFFFIFFFILFYFSFLNFTSLGCRFFFSLFLSSILHLTVCGSTWGRDVGKLRLRRHPLVQYYELGNFSRVDSQFPFIFELLTLYTFTLCRLHSFFVKVITIFIFFAICNLTLIKVTQKQHILLHIHLHIRFLFSSPSPSLSLSPFVLITQKAFKFINIPSDL